MFQNHAAELRRSRQHRPPSARPIPLIVRLPRLILRRKCQRRCLHHHHHTTTSHTRHHQIPNPRHKTTPRHTVLLRPNTIQRPRGATRIRSDEYHGSGGDERSRRRDERPIGGAGIGALLRTHAVFGYGDLSGGGFVLDVHERQRGYQQRLHRLGTYRLLLRNKRIRRRRQILRITIAIRQLLRMSPLHGRCHRTGVECHR
mmetsp:Transcript_19261/g.46242  ORF Transcript_19261/g.46242 Transcript_19261/m.46242 type:complete len:201 (-) Transcript_19261:2803-3405(-)